jgi:ketosteroid isomerase-like protein
VSAEENKAIMRRYFSVFEQGNIDLLDELLAPDYVNHTPPLLSCQRVRRESKEW